MGRSSPSPAPVIVQPPPPTVTQLPQPNPQETSRQLFQSQLEFNPQLTQQAVELQRKFGLPLSQQQADVTRAIAPQLAQSEFETAQRFTPLYRALIESQFPQIPVLSRQVSEGLASPFSLPAEQEALQTAQRQRSREQIQRNVREAANLGGTLFGGRRQEAEAESLRRFEQDTLAQDIARQQQERAQRLAELTQLFQLAGFQVQQPTVGIPNVPQFGQSVTPSPDALMQAIQNSIFVQPAAIGFPQTQPGFGAGLAGGVGRGVGAAATTFALSKLLPLLAACHVAEVLYGINDVRTHLARFYVLTHDSWFLRLYRQRSRQWASWLKRVPVLQLLVKPIWDWMWKRSL